MPCYQVSEPLGCVGSRLEFLSNAGLRMQPYPRAPGHACPSHLPGAGCLNTWAMGTGYPTLLYCLPCCPSLPHPTHIPYLGLLWVCMGPAIVAWGLRCPFTTFTLPWQPPLLHPTRILAWVLLGFPGSCPSVLGFVGCVVCVVSPPLSVRFWVCFVSLVLAFAGCGGRWAPFGPAVACSTCGPYRAALAYWSPRFSPWGDKEGIAVSLFVLAAPGPWSPLGLGEAPRVCWPRLSWGCSLFLPMGGCVPPSPTSDVNWALNLGFGGERCC